MWKRGSRNLIQDPEITCDNWPVKYIESYTAGLFYEIWNDDIRGTENFLWLYVEWVQIKSHCKYLRYIKLGTGIR
jgi:hypothetical protein